MTPRRQPAKAEEPRSAGQFLAAEPQLEIKRRARCDPRPALPGPATACRGLLAPGLFAREDREAGAAGRSSWSVKVSPAGPAPPTAGDARGRPAGEEEICREGGGLSWRGPPPPHAGRRGAALLAGGARLARKGGFGMGERPGGGGGEGKLGWDPQQQRLGLGGLQLPLCGTVGSGDERGFLPPWMGHFMRRRGPRESQLGRKGLPSLGLRG